jgi:hypothetical protein
MSVRLTSPGTVARQSVTSPASYGGSGPPIKSLKPRRSKASAPSFGQTTVQPVLPMGRLPYPRNTVRSSSSLPRSDSGSLELISASIGLRFARAHLCLDRTPVRSSSPPPRSTSASLEFVPVRPASQSSRSVSEQRTKDRSRSNSTQLFPNSHSAPDRRPCLRSGHSDRYLPMGTLCFTSGLQPPRPRSNIALTASPKYKQSLSYWTISHST